MAGVIAVLVGGVLVYLFFPKHEREVSLLEQYQAEDATDQPT
jgi:hypothetical protein